MENKSKCIKYALLLTFFVGVNSQVQLDEFFSNCKKGMETFNECVKDGLNNLRPLYKSGLPQYGIAPFDPFFIPEVAQKRGGGFFNYKLVLRNVTESGWSESQITKLKFDPNKNQLIYTQFFPDKRLNGLYEIEGAMMGSKFHNKGSWNLKLFDYVQTTTITRKAAIDRFGKLHFNTPLKVFIEAQSCKNLELHISHLIGGRSIVEGIADRIINTAWQPGFMMLKPLINDLVSKAFGEIMNKNFANFPFDQVFH